MFPLRRALAALAISMAVPVCAAQAATFNIPNGDVAALNSAISAANASLENDVVNLTAGTYTLATAQNTSSGPTALPPILANSGALTINGNGATVTRSSAQGVPFCRALRVEAGAVVIINDLTISNFKNIDPATTYPNDTDRQGGAVENLGTLTLAKCNLFNNESLSGGSIHNVGALTVNQGSFNASRAKNGGSLENSGTATLNDITFGANAAGRGGALENSGNLTVNRGNIGNNEAAVAGAIQNSGTATFSQTNIQSNRSFNTGAVKNEGTMTLVESLVAGSNYGGITNSQNLVVRQSVFLRNNNSSAGAGISSTGSLQISNTTFRENTVNPPTGGSPIAGTALAIAGSGSASLDSCTIADNSAPAAIAINGGSLTLRNSIVARNGRVDADGNRTSSDIQVSGGTFISGGNNLIGSPGAVTGFVATDQVGTDAAPLDPKLGEFSDNGGFTSTYSLLAGSPALDKGDTALTIDQRGLPRPAGSADDIGAFEAQSPPIPSGALIVTTLADVEDASDGVLSLREAIVRADANDGPDTIRFADNVRGAIELTTALPLISGQLTLEGPGASLLALDGTDTTNILSINISEATAISGLTFRNGNGKFRNDGGGTGRPGAAIGASGLGLLQLRNCAFLNNRSYQAGAINSSGNLLIEGCTFSGNSAISAGALQVSGIGATIRNSTFTGNSVVQGLFGGAQEGGGISVSTGSVSIDSCTITDNTISGTPSPFNVPGGGVSASSATGSIEIRNSILFGNTNGDAVIFAGTRNPFVSKGNNLIGAGNAASAFSATGDSVGVDPKLGPLADNGGPTQTRALLAGSPAIDAGSTTLTTDQRGVARPQGASADIGAYEVQAATAPESPSLTVTTASDVVANDGQTSLREAINYANAKAGADTINFAGNMTGKLTLGALLPEITSDITLDGPGAPNLAIDGGGKVRLINVARGASLTLNGLTLSGALYDASEGPSGAIFNRGTLSLNYCALTGNTGIEGGAITNLDGTVMIQGTLLSDNTALTVAGALLNNNGVVTVINSTIANNLVTSSDAGSGGGAISTYGDKARLIFDCVTLTGNSAPNANGNLRAGVWMESGVFAPHNSILSGNGARDLQIDGGTLASAGYNIIGLSSTNVGLAGNDLIGIDPILGELADNGGPTQTRALLEGSPAINTGDPAITDGFDQRGSNFPRVRGKRVDIGAFEVQTDESNFTVSLSPVAPRTNDKLTVTSEQPLEGATFVWRRNGAVIEGETAATLDLAKAGNGDKKDVISVAVSQSGSSAAASVAIVNSVPVAVSSQVTVDVDTEKGFALRAFDADGDALTFQRVGGPRNGVKAEIRVDTDGVTKLFYRSRPKFGGVDIIRFVAFDDDNAQSNESTLGISVQYTPPPPVNRKPIAGNTNIDTFVNTSVIKGLLGSDPDGDPITFRIVNNAKYGKSEIKRDADGQFKLFYTSLPKFYGPDRVTYIAIDARGAESNIATVSINFTNRKPVANGNKLTVTSGELVSQYLFGTDEDADVLSFRLVNNPQHGRGEIKRDEYGAWRFYYQSNVGYVGPDQITFIAIDPMGRESFAAAADITVVRASGTPSAPQTAQVATAPSGGSS